MTTHVIACLFAVVAFKDAPPPTTEKQLQDWWADLEADEAKATRAVLALSTRPKDVLPFLRDKLPPLKADKDQMRKWLSELGSDDEKVWRSAFDRLWYVDPRLAMDGKALTAESLSEVTLQRLWAVVGEFDPSKYAGKAVKLTRARDFGYFFIAQGAPNQPQTDVTFPLSEGVFWLYRRSWTRAVRAVALLEHIGTPDALAILKDMATGHPDAAPTRAAKDAVARLARPRP